MIGIERELYAVMLRAVTCLRGRIPGPDVPKSQSPNSRLQAPDPRPHRPQTRKQFQTNEAVEKDENIEETERKTLFIKIEWQNGKRKEESRDTGEANILKKLLKKLLF